MSVGFDRRTVLAGAAVLGALALLPTPLAARAMAGEALPSVTSRDLKVGARTTKLFVFTPAGKPRGIALFSTGHGSTPTRYIRVIQLLNAQGFAVLAPVHVDSLDYPDRRKFTPQQGLFERFADMEATTQVAAAEFPGLPMIAAGHSYGSLISFAQGGAMANMMPVRNPAVKAVLAFSTPGRIPGLVSDATFASIAVPLLEISGTNDVIPAGMGYASAPADHLMPIELSPATSFGVVVDGADHLLVDNAPGLDRVAPAIELFLRGYALDDAKARKALLHWRAAGPDRFLAYEKAR